MQTRIINGSYQFDLVDEGDSFEAAKQWVFENVQPSHFPLHDDVASRRGEWRWACFTYRIDHPFEATDSGTFWTTSIDEAVQFMLASGQFTGL